MHIQLTFLLLEHKCKMPRPWKFMKNLVEVDLDIENNGIIQLVVPYRYEGRLSQV